MAFCSIPDKNLASGLIIKLKAADPKLYSNFDNFLKKIVELQDKIDDNLIKRGSKPMSDLKRAIVIYQAAVSYQNLSKTLGADNFNTGTFGDKIIANGDKLSNVSDFLNYVQEQTGLNVGPVDVSDVDFSLSSIKKKNVDLLSRGDIQSYHSTLLAYMETQQFPTKSQMLFYFDKRMNDLRQVFSGLSDAGKIDFFTRYVNELQENNRPVFKGEGGTLTNNKYVDVNTILSSEAAREKNLDLGYAITADNVVRQGFINPAGNFVYESNGVSVEVPRGELIDGPKLFSESKAVTNNKKNVHVFDQSTITGGFETIPFSSNSKEATKEFKTLSKDPHWLKENTRVLAVPTTPHTTERITALKEVAAENSSVGDLTNRDFETFETEAQKEILRSSEDGIVLTYLQEREEFYPYTFVTVTKTSEGNVWHHLKTPNTLAFVDSNNNVIPVDFNNKEHLKLVKALSTKKVEIVNKNLGNKVVKFESLTNEDVKSLGLAALNFTNLTQTVMKALPSRMVTDVNSWFYDSFTLNVQTAKSTLGLNSYLSDTPQANFRFTTVTASDPRTIIEYNKAKALDPSTTLASFKEKTGRTIGNPEITETALMVMIEKGEPTLYNMFSTDQYILGPDGLLYNPRTFITNSVGLTTERLKNIITGLDKTGTFNLIIQAVNSSAINDFSTVIDDSAQYKFRILGRKSVTESFTGYTEFALGLDEMMEGLATLAETEPDAGKDKDATKRLGSKVNQFVQKFRSEMFGLKYFKPYSKALYKAGLNVGTVYLNIDASATGNALQFQINVEDGILEGLSKNNAFKGSLKYTIPSGLVKQLVDVVDPNVNSILGNLVEKFGLTGLPIKEVMSKLEELYNNNEYVSEIQPFYNSIEDLAFQLGEVAYETVAKFKKALEEVGEGTEEYKLIAKEAFGNIDDMFTTSSMNEKGKVQHKIVLLPRSSTKEAFYNNTNNYFITEDNSEVALSAAPIVEQMNVTSAAKEKNKAAQESAEPVVTKPLNEGLASLDDFGIIEDEAPFELGTSETTIAPLAEVKNQIELVREILPMFNIEESDMSEFLELLGEDGVVLGYMKDRVIYLNKNINSSGTVFHEAFHGVFRYLLNSSQRAALIDNVKKSRKNTKLFTKESLEAFAKRRGLPFNRENIENLQAEEILADGFKKFMLENKQPRESWFKELVKLLKKIINMFMSTSKDIDALYNSISRGHFKAATLQKTDFFKGKVAHELLVGSQELSIGADDRYKATASLFTPDTQNELIMAIVKQLTANYKREFSFDKNFDLARLSLLDTYDLEKLIAQKPENEKEIKKAFGKKYRNFHFLLSYGTNKQNLEVIDDVGFFERNGKALGVSKAHLEQVEKSLTLLKQYVKRTYKVFTIQQPTELTTEEIDELRDIIDNAFTETDIERDFSEEDIEEEGSGSADPFDRNAFSVNVLANVSRDFRKFFSIVAYEQYHPETGVTVTRMADGQAVFNAVLSIVANSYPDQILPRLKSRIDDLQRDGFIDEYYDLKNAYDSFANHVGLDANYKPTKNERLYHEFIDVFSNTQIEMMGAKLTTKTRQISPDIPAETYNYFSFDDLITKSDVNAKKERLVQGLITKYKMDTAGMSELEKQEYAKKIELFRKAIESKITNSSKLRPILGYDANNSQLEAVAKEIHDGLTLIGFKVPYSLVELSIMALDTFDNQTSLLSIDGQPLERLRANMDLINQKAYMTKDFFKDIWSVADNLAKGIAGKKRVTVDTLLKQYTDAGGKKSNQVGSRLNIAARNISKYIIKYDPNNLQSVVLNSEKKPIYRYSKSTPSQTIANDIRQKGLEQYLKENPYYNEYLNKWFEDHPWMKSVKREIKDIADAQIQVFLENINISINGGISQTINDKPRAGKSFKNIDSQALYIIDLIGFMNRRVDTKEIDVTDKNGVVSTRRVASTSFKKSLGQLEGSSTNFFTDSFYFEGLLNSYNGQVTTQFGSSMNIKADVKVPKAVEIALPMVIQEYNRIQREWSTRYERLERREAGNNTFMSDYNATRDKDGAINVTNQGWKPSKGGFAPALRAYHFGVFSRMFNNSLPSADNIPANVTGAQRVLMERSINVRQALRKAAFEGIPFEQLDKGILDNLAKVMTSYQESIYLEHLTDLKKHGIVEFEMVPNTNRVNLTKVKLTNIVATDFKYSGDYAAIDDLKADSKTGKIGLENLYNPSTGTATRDEAFLRDQFLNHYLNGLYATQIYTGDMGMSVADAVEYIKRSKSLVASGPSFKRGVHNVAVTDALVALRHPDRVELGYHTSIDKAREVLNDLLDTGQLILKDTETIEGLLESFETVEIFDAQSISHLMHQIDMFEDLGRLDETSSKLLIEAQWRDLTKAEIMYLYNNKVVLNSKKTVTAGMVDYHKLSEHMILRPDVAYVVDPTFEKTLRIKELHEQWHALRKENRSLYDKLKTDFVRGNSMLDPTQDAEYQTNQAKIDEIITEIHSYYAPLRGKEMLFDILFSMERHSIDQMMDTNASKKATIFPINVADKQDGYINFSLAKVPIDSRFKYLQIETSGVKDEAKASVQSKLLISADKQFLIQRDIEELTKKLGAAPTKKQRDEIASKYDVFDEFQESLANLTNANFEMFKRFGVGNDGKFNIPELFRTIQNALLKQGSSENVVKLFELDVNGQPVHTQHLSFITDIVKYHFYSMMSNNLTQESVKGGKLFHVASYGHELVYAKADVGFEDGTVYRKGEIVKQYDLKANPEKFNSDLFGTRYPGVRIEESKGVRTYFVEAIIPDGFFKDDPTFKEFFESKLTKMFATRIPTEDKRSMIAMEIVDYMNAAYLNSVVVSHLVHELSGSDFDIDTVYTQMFSFAKGIDGKFFKYGDAVTSEEKFNELVTFLKENRFFNDLVRAERDDMRSLELTQEGLNLMEMAGYDPQEVLAYFNMLGDEGVKESLDEMREEYEIFKREVYVPLRLENETLAEEMGDAYVGEIGGWTEQGEVSSELREMGKELDRLSQEYVKAKQMFRVIAEYEALIKVMAAKQLPLTVEELAENPQFYNLVTPVFQNINLSHKLGILSNEGVFNKLYIQERSSVAAQEDLAKNTIGKTVKEVSESRELFTADGQIISKELSGASGRAIGIAATTNKVLSLASQFNLTLSKKNLIWKTMKDGKVVDHLAFGKETQSVQDGEILYQRAISIVGNYIGMFTDSIKNPIPALLNLNAVNTPITLSLISLGIPEKLAILINFIPELQQTARKVLASSNALTQETDNTKVSLGRELTAVINNLLKANDNALFDELIDTGLILESSQPWNPKLDKKAYAVSFNEDVVLETNDYENLSLSDLGISVTNQAGENVYSEAAQKFVILTLYKQQNSQNFQLNKLSSAGNFFKKLKPDHTVQESMLEALVDLKSNGTIFSNSESMFKGNTVWNAYLNIAQFIDQQASDLFLDRKPAVKAIMDIVGNASTDKAKVLEQIVGFLTLRSYKNKLFRDYINAPNEIARQNARQIKNDAMTIMGGSVNYWFNVKQVGTRTMREDYQFLLGYAPDNYFVKQLSINYSDKSPTVIDQNGDKLNPAESAQYRRSYLSMYSKTKLQKEFKAKVINDFEALFKDPNTRFVAYRLFFNELARTGLGKAPGSFLDIVNPKLIEPISNALKEFESIIDDRSSTQEAKENRLKEFFGETEKEGMLEEMMDDLLTQTVVKAITDPNNTSIQDTKQLQVDGKGSINRDLLSSEPGVLDKILSQIFDTKISYSNKKYGKVFKPFYPQGSISEKRTIVDTDIETSLFKHKKILFTVDLTPKENIMHAGLEKIANTMNISFNEETGLFTFPLVIKTGMGAADNFSYGHMSNLVIDSIDGVPIQKIILNAMLTGSGLNKLEGRVVKYTSIDKRLGVSGMSTATFSKEMAYKMFNLENAPNAKTFLEEPAANYNNLIVDTNFEEEIPEYLKEGEVVMDFAKDPLYDSLSKFDSGLKKQTTEKAPILEDRYAIYKNKIYVIVDRQRNDALDPVLFAPGDKGGVTVNAPYQDVIVLDQAAPTFYYNSKPYAMLANESVLDLKSGEIIPKDVMKDLYSGLSVAYNDYININGINPAGGVKEDVARSFYNKPSQQTDLTYEQYLTKFVTTLKHRGDRSTDQLKQDLKC